MYVCESVLFPTNSYYFEKRVGAFPFLLYTHEPIHSKKLMLHLEAKKIYEK